MKDATMVTLAGYRMATIVSIALLITDGQVAATAALAVIGVGTGLGQFLGARAKGA